MYAKDTTYSSHPTKNIRHAASVSRFCQNPELILRPDNPAVSLLSLRLITTFEEQEMKNKNKKCHSRYLFV